MKIDADEKELLESVERGEWKSAGGGKRYSRYAKATFRKDQCTRSRRSVSEALLTPENCAVLLIETNQTREQLKDPEWAGYMLGKTRLGRLGRLEELASVALFLASEESSVRDGR